MHNSIQNRQIDDESALQCLLMERAERLHGYVERKIPSELRSRIPAEDVLQEVWVAVFRGIANFREDGPDAFDRWLTSITQSKVVDAIRRAGRLKRGGGHRFAHEAQRRTTSYLDLSARVSAEQRTPSSEDAAKEAVHAVQIALSTLPADYRCAITMHHIEGRSHAEVAEAMTRTRPAVNSLLYRGLHMLRKQLEPAGRFFSDDG